jgi:hypothetical protein
MSWFLYIVTQDHIDDEGKQVLAGEAGVGMCSMSPGIMDSYKGVMYIVPEKYIQVIEISPDDKNFFMD